ncbi:hypothetical protein ACHAWF_017773, partial [Thalassiosira exigua]
PARSLGREQHPVQVIELVLRHPRRQPRQTPRLPLGPVLVQPRHDHLLRSLHPPPHARDAQAPFPHPTRLLRSPRDLGIDPRLQRHLGRVGIARVRPLDPEAEGARPPPDLRRRDADPAVLFHGPGEHRDLSLEGLRPDLLGRRRRLGLHEPTVAQIAEGRDQGDGRVRVVVAPALITAWGFDEVVVVR